MVEVVLDKGVSERELAEDEKPWFIMQKNRKVSQVNYFPIQDMC